mmetsp:Transcript_101636/g.180514  ORF Transcript_101636/g.180514 Transcript_101636/m.180514 type:complete len:215 (-) Transcript_101636:83-727(-)|eukprot:CAMPEP_0197656146 /NCGR_PEP_ID=MMETSP1338-20131121/40486_1 /TAXON_ID=43686 ORGANISM="Pelagodinium beii, Strain RCC1491" /NCGR_SAMPLE_ID=MMETSP1338 /ASSEMBLY_ACC=CAM_ASM_000754 /LENGTH=214 /DNA_ID=CAMNT_0043232001 /DNA_START=24 /DNA_END=668 /DNA_ORIENTATION=-
MACICCVPDKNENELQFSSGLGETHHQNIVKQEPALFGGVARTGQAFEVEYDFTGGTQNLDLTLDTTDGKFILIAVVGTQPHLNGKALKRFDAIVAVNGEAASRVNLSMENLNGKKVKMSIFRPAEREVILRRPGKLGITAHYRKSSIASWIASMSEPGLVYEWNSANPDKSVALFDRLISVNGDSGTPEEVVAMMKSENDLILKVLHYAEDSH